MTIRPMLLSLRSVLCATACLFLNPGLRAQDADTPPPDETRAAVAALLAEFLARVDDPGMHARFWADDLVYTSGRGEVLTKDAIVRSVAAAAASAGARTTYGAEDVHVRAYGRFAALNFRLLVRTADGGTWHSRNSGAFLWRDGRWQVVTWQATREAEPTK